MNRTVTDEEIAAFVDGSLPEADVARVAQAVAGDPEAAEMVRRLRALNETLRDAFDAPMREAVPPAIAAALGQAGPTVVALPRRARMAWWPVAAAAGVALAVGLGLGASFAPEPPAPVVMATAGPLDPAGPMHAVLERQPAGVAGPDGTVIVLTMRDAAGRPCREFEYPTPGSKGLTFGLACRERGGTWEVQILVEAPAVAAVQDGFVPADGPGQEAMDALLARLGGAVLAPEEEARLIAGGWE